MLCIWIWYLIVTAAVGTVGIDSYCKCKNSEDIVLIPPFGCGDKFALDGCDGSDGSVLWHGFSDDPTVISIFNNNNYTDYSYIDLTWNQENVDKTCPLPMAQDGFPLQIDLRPTDFHFSELNVFLFLNCSSDSNFSIGHWYGIDSSPNCKSYSKQCMTDINENGKCVELLLNRSTINNVLNITETGSLWNCTHFQAIVMKPDNKWKWGMIELGWSSRSFKNCTASDNCNKNAKSKTAIIAGLAAAASLIVIVAVILLLFLLRRRRRKNGYNTRSIPNSSTKSGCNSNKIWSQRALQLSSKYGDLICVKEFHYTDLHQATKGFSDENIVGDGGFGAVYLGILKNGTKVAVKKLYHENFKRMEQFYNEMQILSKLNHPNLVKLFGFCCQDNNELFLVFEYATNGTVFDLLQESDSRKMLWERRINIAWETANALSYLHNSQNPPIYHRDVKTTNILLDDEFHVKLADFGLSRLVPLNRTHISTAPQGTPGYLDPEYHECYQLTDKSDVFSFGVVLMELVSGLPAVDLERNRKEINLSSLAMAKIKMGAWKDLVDSKLEMEKHPEDVPSIKGVIEVAFMCLHEEKDSRPSMKEVAENLDRLRREYHGDSQLEKETADLTKSGPPFLQRNHQNGGMKSGTNSMASSMCSSSKTDDESFSF